MKHLLYSDTHWRPERINDLVLCHKEIAKIALEHNVPQGGGLVINGGDTFHTRGLIHTDCFDALVNIRSDWYAQGIRHVDIVGNHDQADRDGRIHPLKIFEKFDGWRVVDKPCYDAEYKILFIPYMRDLESFLKNAPTVDCHAAIVHAGIKGAYMNDTAQDRDGVDVDLFSIFPKVFSGHYHKRQVIENVHYIGSPLQQNFNEKGQDKGVIIYDPDAQSVEFVPILGTPKHYEVECQIVDGIRVMGDTSHIEVNDVVRVKLTGRKEEIMGITQSDFGIECSRIKISRNPLDDMVSRIAISKDDSVSFDALVDAYVGHINPELNHKKLTEMGRELVHAEL